MGSSLARGFTCAPTDPTTGFLDLRARNLDPALGRFLSTDSVIPNAPGTQGFNLCAYAANNPTTWADLSGHSVGSDVNSIASLVAGCLAYGPCSVLLEEQVALTAAAVVSGNWLLGIGAAVATVFVLVWCVLTEPCMQAAQDIQLIATTYGGGVDTGGGNRPPSPASCVWDAVKGWAGGVGNPADGVHACAEAIRTSTASESTVNPIQGGSGPVTPQKAYTVYNYIKHNNWTPMPGYAGNSVFLNTLNQLPPVPEGDYHEYDIDPRPAPGGPGRNAERIVVNVKTGEAWYTSNHYGQVSDGNPPFLPMF